MHLIIILLLSLWPLSKSIAMEKIVVRNPSLTENEFSQIVATRGNLLSFVNFSVNEQKLQTVRQQIFEIMDQCLGNNDCRSLEKNFLELRSRLALNPNERELLKELWKKSGRPLGCYWQTSPKASCKLKKLRLETLPQLSKSAYAIFIDGIIYKPGQEIWLLPDMKYQVTIVSNDYQPLTMWASLAEIPLQYSMRRAFVQGGCLSSSAIEGLRDDLQKQLYVVFDSSCIRPLSENKMAPIPSPEKSSWMEKNRSWFIPTLAIFAGGVYIMKNYDLEFQSSFR